MSLIERIRAIENARQIAHAAAEQKHIDRIPVLHAQYRKEFHAVRTSQAQRL